MRRHADGSFTTAFESFEEDGSGFGVFAQRFNADGTSSSAKYPVNTTTLREQSAPAIAVDLNGNELVVWQSKGQDEGDTFGIYGQWYNSSGAKLGDEFRINSATAGDQQAPSVAIDGSGDAIVTWQSVGAEDPADTETEDWGVYYTRLDGAGDVRIFWMLALPLIKPGLATVAVFSALSCWNEFLLALLYIQDDALKTIPTGLLAFSTRYVTDYSLLFSALSIVTIPMIVIYVVFNRQIVAGITAGSVK